MNSALRSIRFFDYDLFDGNLNDIFQAIAAGNKLIVNTINPHSFYVADRDSVFKRALQEGDVLLPDGVGIVFANRILNKIRLKRITGMDIFIKLLSNAESSDVIADKRIFFLGSTKDNLEIIKKNIHRDFPSLIVDYFSPPYKEIFSTNDCNVMIDKINSFSPLILFVGMTAPKQEKWGYLNHEKIQANAICSVGAVFDFYSGRIKRPSKVWRMFGLEWLKRFSREPKRLWRRNLISSPYFLYKVGLKVFTNILSGKNLK